MVEAVSRDVPSAEETYAISPRGALDMAVGRWVPLPFFRLLSRASTGQEAYAVGPSNWVRARIVASPAERRTHILTLAFDTALLGQAADGPYVAPSPADSVQQAEFVSCPSHGSTNGSWPRPGWANGCARCGSRRWPPLAQTVRYARRTWGAALSTLPVTGYCWACWLPPGCCPACRC